MNKNPNPEVKFPKKLSIIINSILFIVIIGLFIWFNLMSSNLKNKRTVCEQNKFKSDFNVISHHIDSININNENYLLLISDLRIGRVLKTEEIKTLEHTIILKQEDIKIKERNNQLTKQDIDTLNKYVTKLEQSILNLFDSVRIQDLSIDENKEEILDLENQINKIRRENQIIESNINNLLNRNFSIKIKAVEPLDKDNNEITYSTKINSIKKFKVTYDIVGCIFPIKNEKIKIFIYYKEALIPIDNDFFITKDVSKDLIYYIPVPKLAPGEYKICLFPENKNSTGDCYKITIGKQ